MLSAFASVGARVFDLSITDLTGPVKGCSVRAEALKKCAAGLAAIYRT